MADVAITSRLQALREKKNVSQEIVAEACEISRVALTRYENGTRMPRAQIASRLADYYGVTVDYILGREETPAEQKETATTTEGGDDKIHIMMPRTANGRNMYSQLGPEDRAVINSMIRTLFEKTFGKE